MRTRALFAVAIAVGFHGAALTHALTTEHNRCVVHGELIHGEVEQHSAAAAYTRLTDAEHEHCSVDWLAHSDAAFEEAPSITLVSAEAALAVPVLLPFLAEPLLFAPKTSPPSA